MFNITPVEEQAPMPTESHTQAHNAKLSFEQVHEIRTRVAAGERIKDVSTRMGVGNTTVYLVARGRIYRSHPTPWVEGKVARPYNAKLTDEQVCEIRRRYPTTPVRVLAEEFGVSKNTIMQAAKGHSYTDAPASPAPAKRAQLTAEQVAQARRLYRSGLSMRDVGARLGVSEKAASNAIRGITRRWAGVVDGIPPIPPRSVGRRKGGK